jgi:hypothetical protein
VNKTVLGIGEVVCNQLTREVGKIVRIVNNSDLGHSSTLARNPKGVSYVVFLPASDKSAARECLWRESDLEPASP